MIAIVPLWLNKFHNMLIIIILFLVIFALYMFFRQLSSYMNINNIIEKNKNKKIFSTNIFETKFSIICDEIMAKKYIPIESKMSIYGVNLIYLEYALSDSNLYNISHQIMKKAAPSCELVRKISNDEILKLCNSSKNLTRFSKGFDLTNEIKRCVLNIISKSFFDINIDDNFAKIFNTYSEDVQKNVKLSHFFPISLVKLLFDCRVTKNRSKLFSIILEKSKSSHSQFISFAKSYNQIVTERKLTEEEIVEIILIILYVNVENISYGVSAVITDLLLNPNIVEQIFFKEINIDECIVESFYRNSNLFAFSVKPFDLNYVEKFYVGDSDIIAYCPPFINHNVYNPKKIDANDWCWKKDSYSSDIMNVVISKLLTNFPNMKIKKVGKIEYLSTCAFHKRHSVFSIV